MNLQVLLRSKPFWVNLAAICTAIGMAVSGEMSWGAVFLPISQALGQIFLRDGIANPTKTN